MEMLIGALVGGRIFLLVYYFASSLNTAMTPKNKNNNGGRFDHSACITASLSTAVLRTPLTAAFDAAVRDAE